MKAQLTPREVEVLATLAGGMTQASAAAIFEISTQTLKNHLTSIYAKLDVQGLIGALNVMGWIRISDDYHIAEAEIRLRELQRDVAELSETVERIAERHDRRKRAVA